MKVPKLNGIFGKMIKIIGILLVTIPLLCASHKKINRLEFDNEKSQIEVADLKKIFSENDKRIYKIESDISVILVVYETNQKQILDKLDKIENQIYELNKKAKW